MVAGGTLLARAASLVRTNPRGAATRALVGLGLIAFGLRQRRSSSGREGSPLTLSNGSTAETGSGPDETASAAADGQARTDDTSTADGQPGADETAAERDRSSFAAEALDEEASVDAVTDPHDGEGDDDADGAT